MEKEEKKQEIKQEVKEQEVKHMKALVTSRILFISALDKIMLVVLLLTFISATVTNFSGDVTSSYYGFWGRVGREIIIIIVMLIYYLFLNWFYKCAAKTMLCLTKKEVYKEEYVPFKRSETSIPLNKITGVSTINLFWIFRSVIIHQYGKLPVVFFTWNNQEFKDKLNELITTDKEKIENDHIDKNIIPKDKFKYVLYGGAVLGVIVALIGVVKLFSTVFSEESRINGTYVYGDEKIVLNRNGSCDLVKVKDSTVTSCLWEYDEDDKEVEVEYEYKYYSYYYDGYRNSSDTIYLDYNSNNKTLTYGGNVYKK